MVSLTCKRTLKTLSDYVPALCIKTKCLKYTFAISGRFRQFYFLQRMLITKMKNALKSRSFLYFTLKTEKRMPVFKFHSLL